jgi:hypothetical protein
MVNPVNQLSVDRVEHGTPSPSGGLHTPGINAAYVNRSKSQLGLFLKTMVALLALS